MQSYGIVSKGNGEAWLIEEKHMALCVGGGQAGQGYPCVLIPISERKRKDEQNRMGSRISATAGIESDGDRLSGRESSDPKSR